MAFIGIDKKDLDACFKKISDEQSQAASQLLEEIKAVASRLDKIVERLDALEMSVADLQRPASPPADIIVDYVDSASGPRYSNAPQQQQQQPESNTFYANIERNLLKMVPESAKNLALFVVHATGDKATVKFNQLCVPNMINQLDSRILPIFDCKIDSQNARNIEPMNESTATLNNGRWIMGDKIKLRIY